MLAMPLLGFSVRLEWHALQNVTSSFAIIAVMAAVAVSLRWRTPTASKSPETELQFEESPDPAIFALDLHRDGVLIGTPLASK